MNENNTYLVTLKKGDEVDTMKTSKFKNAHDAGKYVVESFYYDGWHVASVDKVGE